MAGAVRLPFATFFGRRINMARRKLVIANWKMNGSKSFADSLVAELVSGTDSENDVGVIICPPSPYLQQTVSAVSSSKIEIGGQDLSEHTSGAYTGEISADMLVDLGAKWAILGHSERRAYHGESDELIAAKVGAALAAGLTPVCCVGETLEERNAGEMEAVVGRQVKAVVETLDATQLASLVIAYEPVWAIGTGVTATREQAQAVHAYIRSLLGEVGPSVSILYGGSVKPGNAEELFSQPDIDGGLIGGASLVSQDFIKICQAAE